MSATLTMKQTKLEQESKRKNPFVGRTESHPTRGAGPKKQRRFVNACPPPPLHCRKGSSRVLTRIAAQLEVDLRINVAVPGKHLVVLAHKVELLAAEAWKGMENRMCNEKRTLTRNNNENEHCPIRVRDFSKHIPTTCGSPSLPPAPGSTTQAVYANFVM